MSTGNNIEEILSGFAGISLEEVQKASLMRRRDRKHVFGFQHVPALLNEVAKHYRVLEIDGKRIHYYQTLYYDTKGLDMYHMHHSGRVNRHKIRFRKYGSSADLYFEVKKKDSRGITVKNRMQTNGSKAAILSREEEFLSAYTPYDDVEMEPVLENSFKRITMVNQDQSERITMDYDLWFQNRIGQGEMELPGITIVEIKYGNHLAGSLFRGALRRAHIVPTRFSKYCIGMAMLNPELKQNMFKERVRMVDKTSREYEHSKKMQSYA